jgi:hypothetical protein
MSNEYNFVDAERQKKALAEIKKKNDNQDAQKIDVNVDLSGIHSRIKSLEEELENERTEKENLKSKLELVALKAFEKKKAEVGAGDEIDTPEKLQGFILAKQGSGKPPSGTAPLNQGQQGEKTGYSDYGSMIRDLKSMASDSNNRARQIEAQRILDNLLLSKMRTAMKADKPIEVTIPSDSELQEGLGLKDVLNREWKRKHGIKVVDENEN